jgi:hypothetical protein
MISQGYRESHAVARAAVSCMPRTGPSTCCSSRTAGICDTRCSSWVSVASMARVCAISWRSWAVRASMGPAPQIAANMISQGGGGTSSPSGAIPVPSPRRAGKGSGVGHYHPSARLSWHGPCSFPKICSWHTRVAPGFMAMPPAVRMYTPDAAASGPPWTISPRRAGLPSGCLILRGPPALHVIVRRPG